MSDLLERVAIVLDARGYLVAGFTSPREIGEIVDLIGGYPYYDEPLGQPCRIVRETTKADYTAQGFIAHLPANPETQYSYFYVVETD